MRVYGVAGQVGREGSIGEYVRALSEVFCEIKRVLRPAGVCFLNIGGGYVGSGKGAGSGKQTSNPGACIAPSAKPPECKPMDLMFVPARVAIA